MSGIQLLDSRGNPIASQNDTAHYAASREARELKTWNPYLASPDADMWGELDTLVARQRDIVRNHGLASGAIQTLVDNVIGTGFMLAPKPNIRVLRWTREKGREWARDVAAQFRTWANTKDCDVAGEMNFGSMTALAFRTGLMHGEALALPYYFERPGEPWRTRLQLVDPDRLGTPGDKTADPNVRMGIEVDAYGAPVAYYISKRHPVDIGYRVLGFNDYERIPARTEFGRRRVLHIHDRERTGQTRGKPIMSSVLPRFRMLSDYQRNEMKSAIVNSMIAAFVESPISGEQLVDMFGGPSGDRSAGFKKYTGERAAWESKLDGGAVIPLFPGDKVTSFTPSRPNDIFGSFIETIAREIGVATGMPYELIMKDFSKTSYASVRAALMEAWRFFASRRKWMTDNWLQPVYELWLEEAINRGAISAPGFYAQRAAYCDSQWIGSAKGYVDPVREAQAAEDRMRIGVSTLEREAAEQGADWEEILEQRAVELQLMRDLDIPLSAVGAARNAGDVLDEKKPAQEREGQQ
jgi:lambda family phage portal protein